MHYIEVYMYMLSFSLFKRYKSCFKLFIFWSMTLQCVSTARRGTCRARAWPELRTAPSLPSGLTAGSPYTSAWATSMSHWLVSTCFTFLQCLRYAKVKYVYFDNIKQIITIMTYMHKNNNSTTQVFIKSLAEG